MKQWPGTINHQNVLYKKFIRVTATRERGKLYTIEIFATQEVNGSAVWRINTSIDEHNEAVTEQWFITFNPGDRQGFASIEHAVRIGQEEEWREVVAG